MEDIIRACNPTVRYSKFTSNKKIFEEFDGFGEKPFPILVLFYSFLLFQQSKETNIKQTWPPNTSAF